MPLEKYEHVAYLLQGGGALGSFQVGAYQALEEAEYNPDWLVGTSIGAINAAIIAGNKLEQRLPKLLDFWRTITTHELVPTLSIPLLQKTYNSWGAHMSMTFGQQGFFIPRLINPWLTWETSPEYLSYYDTMPLRATLERLIDFDRINSKEVRLSLGAVEIESGQLIYFDNHTRTITPQHVMASSALPPGFPAINIDGKYYWDGGLHSSTPLEKVLDDLPHSNTLCFMIDLFSSEGHLPQTLDDVINRKNDISFSSQSSNMARIYTLRQNLQHAIAELYENLSAEKKKLPQLKALAELGNQAILQLVHIVYKNEPTELSSKDYNFSQSAIEQHIAKGYQNTEMILKDQ